MIFLSVVILFVAFLFYLTVRIVAPNWLAEYRVWVAVGLFVVLELGLWVWFYWAAHQIPDDAVVLEPPPRLEAPRKQPNRE